MTRATITGRIGALAGAAGLLAIVVTGCGSSSDDSDISAARSSAYAALSSSRAAATKVKLPIPSAADLDRQIKQALDPKLPDDVRLALIQDGEAFRATIPDLYKALHENPNAKYGVRDPVFDNHDGTITATLSLDKDGTGNAVRTTIVRFVDVDGKWKISRTDLCGILRSANYSTPACG